MSIWHEIASAFWSPAIWLPKNTTWNDVAPGSRPNINHAESGDLLWSLPMAIALFAIRYCCENYIFHAFGQWLNIKSARSSKRRTPNRILEAAYIKCNRLDDRTALGLTKQLDSMTQREIERWWRLRKAQDKPTPIQKFCESSWRCLYHTCSFSFGLIVLWNKPWLWDFKHFWLDYPHHSVDNGVWFYMMVSLSLYLSLLVSQFFDVKRKDFWMMFAHHIVTILAFSISWISHFHRIGSLVLLYLDVTNIFLRAAKAAKYAKYHKICDSIMALFVVAWMISRMMLYPRLVYCAVVKSFHSRRATMVSHTLVCLLVLLQCFHIVWTCMILKMTYVMLKVGAARTKDCRSDSGSGESDHGNIENRGKVH